MGFVRSYCKKQSLARSDNFAVNFNEYHFVLKYSNGAYKRVTYSFALFSHFACSDVTKPYSGPNEGKKTSNMTQLSKVVKMVGQVSCVLVHVNFNTTFCFKIGIKLSYNFS